MKRIVKFIVGLLALCLTLTACQPTPEEEIVVNRGDGGMEEKIFGETSRSTAMEKVSYWEEFIQITDSFTVEIACPVEWGEGDLYPVNRYAPSVFTAKKIVELSNLFFGDIIGLREQEVSYEELINRLLQLDKGCYEGLDEKGNAIWTPYAAEEKAEKEAEIRTQMNQTPVADTYIPFSAETLPLQKAGHTHLTLQRQDGALGYGDVFLEDEHWSLYLNTGDGNVMLSEVAEGDNSKVSFTPSLTKEEAQKRAEAIMAAVGVERMALAFATKAKYGAYGEVYSEGWLLTYAPALAGTQTMSLLGYGRHEGFRDTFTEEYVSLFQPEELKLYVSEKGVEYMQWSNPYALLEVTNENVSLLPFEKVQSCVKSYMQLGFARAAENGSGDIHKITVKRVVLTSTLVHVREDLETGYRVPVWAIFYCSDVDKQMHYPESVLLVNALDGTLVR